MFFFFLFPFSFFLFPFSFTSGVPSSSFYTKTPFGHHGTWEFLCVQIVRGFIDHWELIYQKSSLLIWILGLLNKLRFEILLFLFFSFLFSFFFSFFFFSFFFFIYLFVCFFFFFLLFYFSIFFFFFSFSFFLFSFFFSFLFFLLFNIKNKTSIKCLFYIISLICLFLLLFIIYSFISEHAQNWKCKGK